ncbi:FadR/GntR family transcriptional regulator [Marinomonas sp.]
MASNNKTKISLPQQTVIKVKQHIQDHELAPGDKLPTEPNLMKVLGVSRTVLREAITILKTEGLVKAKQGVGVFVSQPPQAVPELLINNPKTLTDTIDSLELRAAVEVQAVALAIQRGSTAQHAEIYRCYDAYEKKCQQGGNAEQEDFNFHLAIAKATNNQHFVNFLTVLGKQTIPRARLREQAGLARDPNMEKSLNNEHQAILQAIENSNVQEAQEAMTNHLSNGCQRYRRLMRDIERNKPQS